MLHEHKKAIAWSISYIKGINPSFSTHKILMEDNVKLRVQPQRRLNLNMLEVVEKEVQKLLDAAIVYPIFYSPWVSPVQVVPKKGGLTVVFNEHNELLLNHIATGWHICIDYQNLNGAMLRTIFLCLLLIKCWSSYPIICFTVS